MAKGIEHMQERNYQRGQIARNAMVQRSDAFWSRIRAAQRRDSEVRRSMVEGIRSRFDKMRNLFATVQERQDSQAQQNKAALSSWVNGAFSSHVNQSKQNSFNVLYLPIVVLRYGGQSQISVELGQSAEREK